MCMCFSYVFLCVFYALLIVFLCVPVTFQALFLPLDSRLWREHLLRSTPDISDIAFMCFYAFPGPLQKDARQTTIQFCGTHAPRSLTATRLVTKVVMSARPHNLQFWSHVNPPIPQSLPRVRKTESLFPHKVRGIVESDGILVV